MKILKIISITTLFLFVFIFAYTRIERITPLNFVDHNEINHGVFSDVAIHGFDPVSYHTENKAVKGRSDITLEWHGAIWRFATEHNRSQFESSPEKYAPLFGGYCAFAGSKGFTADTDPNVFEILDGQLLLFATDDVRKEWMKDPEANINTCHKNWED